MNQLNTAEHHGSRGHPEHGYTEPATWRGCPLQKKDGHK